MTGLTIGSLFSGMGGLDRAAEQVFGARTVWVSDIDKGACKVLAYRYPHAPNLGDITRIDWATVPRVGIITGGYPCQPFSQAGRRLGQEDERHLWPYVADALAVLRPTFVLFENVRGHLSLGFDEVVRDLHQLGYDVEWVLVKASDIGACHQRARLFILGVNRERRVRSRLDRRRGLHRHQQDGSQHVCDPCPGGDGRRRARPSCMLHEGRVRRQDREASGGDGAARREGRLGRGWAEAATFLEAIQPHLILKSEQAACALDLWASILASRSQYGRKHWTDALRRHAHHLMLRVQELNARGPAAPAPELPRDRVPIARYRWGEWWETEESLFGPTPFAESFPTSGSMIAGHLFAAPEPAATESADRGACRLRPSAGLQGLARSDGEPQRPNDTDTLSRARWPDLI